MPGRHFQTPRSFRDDEDGAASVDWSLLTLAGMGVGVAVAALAFFGSDEATKTVKGTLEDEDLPSQIFPTHTE